MFYFQKNKHDRGVSFKKCEFAVLVIVMKQYLINLGTNNSILNNSVSNFVTSKDDEK